MNTPTPDSVELKFKAIGQMTVEKVSAIQRAVFLEMGKRIIERTPVATGRARSGWNADVEEFNTEVSFPFATNQFLTGDEATQKAINSTLAATGKHKTGQDLTLSNNVEYITYLNNGSSKQAPAGMTDEVINEFEGVVRVLEDRA